MAEQRTKLQDLINYEEKSYLSKSDIAWIQQTFKGNDEAVDILRKLFLPSVGDTRLPLEEIGKDLWLSIDFRNIAEVDIKPIVLARQDMIKMIAGTLVQLKIIANQPEEDKEAIAEAKAKNSAK